LKLGQTKPLDPTNKNAWSIFISSLESPPMRSLLFVPADSEKKIAKALSVGADCLILDLEDSVAPARKSAARPLAAAFVAETRKLAKRPKLYVRINALDTAEWEADLAAVLPARPDGIMHPKPRSAEDVAHLAIALDHAEAKIGITPGATRIIAITTEVPMAVLTMPSYLDASARLEALTWGAEDLSALVGSSATREPGGGWTSPYKLARDLCLFTALAAGRQPIDTVYVDFRDTTGLAEEARIAARDGFTGKMAIHPDQVATINAAFTPTAAETAWAHEIIALFRDNPGAGALSLRGQMIDRPHAVRADRILTRAKLAGH
jgi:citrate lyase subunit beta / citryl-CoA lyase